MSDALCVVASLRKGDRFHEQVTFREAWRARHYRAFVSCECLRSVLDVCSTTACANCSIADARFAIAYESKVPTLAKKGRQGHGLFSIGLKAARNLNSVGLREDLALIGLFG